MKLLRSEHYYLATPACPNTWLHLATVQQGLREFICFQNTITGLVYIEEMIGDRGPYYIESEELVEEIKAFLDDKKLLQITKPPIPDREWYNKLKK